MEWVTASLTAHFGAITSAFLLDLATDYGVFLLAALGLYLLMSAGQVSLGHAGLMGIGAYAAAVLAVRLDVPFWAALPLCGVVGLAAGAIYCLLLGWRLSGFYLAIGTFAFGEMLINIWLTVDYFGGAIGISGIPRTRWPILVIVIPLAIVALWRLERSRFGLAFRAIRDNEVVAGSMGVNVGRTKLIAWMVAGFITGLAGCLHAHRVTIITPPEFGIYTSITMLLAVLLGGLRTVWGALVGSAIIYFGPWITTTDEPRDRLMFYGALIVVLMVLRPQGLFSPRGQRS